MTENDEGFNSSEDVTILQTQALNAVICMDCVIENVDNLDDDDTFEVPTEPCVIFNGQSYCVNHFVEMITGALTPCNCDGEEE